MVYGILHVCRYEQGFTECCQHLIKVGLAEKEKRDKELAMFREAHSEACAQNQQQSSDKVREFEKLKQKVVRSLLLSNRRCSP